MDIIAGFKLLVMASIFVAEAHGVEAPVPPAPNAFVVPADFCHPGAVAGSCAYGPQAQSPGDSAAADSPGDAGASSGTGGGGATGGGDCR